MSWNIGDAQWAFVRHVGALFESQGPESVEDKKALLELALQRTAGPSGKALTYEHASAALGSEDGYQALVKDQVIDSQALREAQALLRSMGFPADRAFQQKIQGGLQGLRAAIADFPDPEQAMQTALAFRPTNEQRQTLLALLAEQPSDGRAIIKELSHNPGLGALFHEWIGVREAQSIGTHSANVHDQMIDQMAHYTVDDIRIPDVDLKKVLAILPALHDIGKGVAVAAGDKTRQHEFTISFLQKIPEGYGFNKKEVALLEAIVLHDAIGYTIWDKRETYDVDDAVADIRSAAGELGMDSTDFFRLKLLFYVSDSSAYAKLRKSVYARFGSGRLFHTGNRFSALIEAFGLTYT